MEPNSNEEQKTGHCPYCGTQLPNNVGQCPICGEKITVVDVKNTQGKCAAIFACILMVLLLLFIILSVSGVLNKASDENRPDPISSLDIMAFHNEAKFS